MGDIRLDAAIPILRSFSEEKARAFYVGFLGFSVDWEHRFAPGLPLYMQVSRDGLALHISEHHGDATPGSAVFLRMRGIEAFHAELLGKHDVHARPGLERAPWGARTVTVLDPAGNRLFFNEYDAGA